MFKRRSCEKLCCERHHSFTFVFTFSVVVVDLQTDCILSFPFPVETDVVVPVFSYSTDVVVVNFVAVLKFPIFSAPGSIAHGSIRLLPRARPLVGNHLYPTPPQTSNGYVDHLGREGRNGFDSSCGCF